MSIYCLASGKGGVGKTTIVANLGLMLGENDKKILLVDGDLADGDLAFYLGLEYPTPTLHDLLSGEEEFVENAVRSISKNVDLLPSGKSIAGFLKAKTSKLEDIISEFSKGYDVTLLDSPPGINRNSIIPVKASNQILLIATPDEASVSGAGNMARIGTLLDREVRGVIVNKGRGRSFFSRIFFGLFGKDTQMSSEEIEKRLGTEILGTIPEDDNLRESTEIGEPIVSRGDGDVFEAFEELSTKFG